MGKSEKSHKYAVLFLDRTHNKNLQPIFVADLEEAQVVSMARPRLMGRDRSEFEVVVIPYLEFLRREAELKEPHALLLGDQKWNLRGVSTFRIDRPLENWDEREKLGGP